MIFKNNKRVLKITTLFMALVMFAMVIIPATPSMAEGDTAAYNTKAEKIVQNIYDKFMKDGKVATSSLTELDGFAISVLNKANIDVLSWKYDNVTVEEKLDTLIADAITKESDAATAIDAKHMANLYVAANSSNKIIEAEKILGYLKARQSKSVNGGFKDGDYSEYTNIPVFDILTSEGKLKLLENVDKAFEYIKNLNPVKSEYPDFMTISQTARILKGFETQLSKQGTNELIKPMLGWIKANQASDGSFNASGGDAITNTSEVLLTIKSVGTSDSFIVADKDNALKYIIAKDEFGNIASNVWALRTLLLNGANPNFNPVVSIDPEKPLNNEIKINIVLIDDNDKVIYGPAAMTLIANEKFGLTALGALDKAGVDYKVDDKNNFVSEINKIANIGLSGWMYSVNGAAPEVPAIDKIILDGDKVIWYYSKSSTAGVPSFPAIATFTDIGTDMSWAKEAIEMLSERKIISGTGNNLFEPKRSINRAEFSKLVVEVLGDKLVSKGTEIFSDVDSTKWYADYIGKAYASDLIKGNDNKFRPLDSINRNEVAVILHRMQKNEQPTNDIISFKDVASIPVWARTSVAYAVEKGLLKGYEDNNFKGEQPMTRAEVSVVLYRYIKMMGL